MAVLLLVAGTALYCSRNLYKKTSFFRGFGEKATGFSTHLRDRVSGVAARFKKSAPVPARKTDALSPVQNNAVPAVPAAVPHELSGMVLLKGGKFMMGSPANSGESDEHPQHEVRLDPFYIDKNDVTVAEYAACVKAGVCHEAQGQGCFSEGDGFEKYPANCVVWDDASKYCSWKGKALPTEAQWEYAARGGTETTYSFGNDASQLGAYAWYDRNADDKPHPVGTKKPNPYGLYDMHGNVWQWTADWYSYNYHGLDGTNPLRSKKTSRYKVLRGGSAVEDADAARTANRFRQDPQKQDKTTGFRCAAAAR
jgi:formylglycine-generating enzyme required for sulfatase activity